MGQNVKGNHGLLRKFNICLRPIIQLLHDVELNPGPTNWSTNANGKKSVNVSIAHLNVRSLICRDHYVLVKETVLANKFDIFTDTKHGSIAQLQTWKLKSSGMLATAKVAVSVSMFPEILRPSTCVTSYATPRPASSNFGSKSRSGILKSFIVCAT